MQEGDGYGGRILREQSREMQLENLPVRRHSDVDLEVGELVVVLFVLTPGKVGCPGLLGVGQPVPGDAEGAYCGVRLRLVVGRDGDAGVLHEGGEAADFVLGDVERERDGAAGNPTGEVTEGSEGHGGQRSVWMFNLKRWRLGVGYSMLL